MESGVQDAENPDEWKDEIRNEVMAETVEEEGSDGDQSQETESNLWDQAEEKEATADGGTGTGRDMGQIHAVTFGQTQVPPRSMNQMVSQPLQPDAHPLVFCCYFARECKCDWDHRRRGCKFIHGELSPGDQLAVAQGRAYLVCDRKFHYGYCKHQETGEHI